MKRSEAFCATLARYRIGPTEAGRLSNRPKQQISAYCQANGPEITPEKAEEILLMVGKGSYAMLSYYEGLLDGARLKRA